MGEPGRPSYLDFAATSPVDQRVADLVMRLMVSEFGNAGSRTHAYGADAAKRVERAREQVARVVGAESADVIFTSGATEADNLAILGLAAAGVASGRTHIVSTAVEHKAVLEPIEALAARGFEVTHVPTGPSGAVDAGDVMAAIRPTTLLVSVMHVNNETGVRQPIDEIADQLVRTIDGPFLHTDAAQGFAKELDALRHPRIDMISISGHKVFAPKGVGALVLRRRDRRRPPLQALMFGGGQEKGLRPGTIPVPLVAGLGLAAELAVTEHDERVTSALSARASLLDALAPFQPVVNGDPALALPHILNVSIPGLDSEAAMLALKDTVAISNGSACTSSSYEPSHVLTAMGVDDDVRRGALRFSWGPTATMPSTQEIRAALATVT